MFPNLVGLPSASAEQLLRSSRFAYNEPVSGIEFFWFLTSGKISGTVLIFASAPSTEFIPLAINDANSLTEPLLE